MPFKKISDDEYRSPSGKIFNKAQVAMYYATNGFEDKPRSKKKSKKGKRRGKR